MKRILKVHPLPHVVICDTNILWHEEKLAVASPDFEAFWSKHVPQFDLSLVIPEVVKGELLFQHCMSCYKLLKSTEDNLQKISGITSANHSTRLTPDKIKSQIQKKFDDWIRTHKATVLPIPVANINWARVTHDAIWRISPFEPDAKNPDGEKGFRDAMIMETVCAFVQSDRRQINIAFLCNDYVLRTATAARLKPDFRFVAYETLKDFESYLGPTKEKLTNEFIAKILSRANARFFTRDDSTCLVLREKLADRLRNDFGHYFDDVSKSEQPSITSSGLGTGSPSWSPMSSGNFLSL